MKKDEMVEALKKYKEQNVRRYGIKSLGVFGSVARNDETESSDIDIVVELDRADLFILADIKQDIEETLGRHVDIVRKRRLMNPLLARRISREVIYV
jgi:hypothetical protein